MKKFRNLFKFEFSSEIERYLGVRLRLYQKIILEMQKGSFIWRQ